MVESFSLFELNEHIRRVLALNFEEAIWVRCEISQVGSSRGHYYLELIEKAPDSEDLKAQNRGVIWARTYYTLKKKYGPVLDEILQDGVDVQIKVKVDFHERYGLKLMVEDVDPGFTVGNLELQRREILEALQKNKLIGKNAMVPVPRVIQRIAVLSAEHAAGYQDFKEHLVENPYHYFFDLDLYTVALQGSKVEGEIVDAIGEVTKAYRHYDCVVIIRGGGSRIDLGSFDSYAIGEKIALCPIPVFTGIGHEIDTTVADVVAHKALKTPTAVADHLIDHNERFESQCQELFDQIVYQVDLQVDNARKSLANISSILSYVPRARITGQFQWLNALPPRLLHLKSSILRQHESGLAHAEKMVTTLDPQNTLMRGFSITRKNGELVTGSKQLKRGDEVTTQLKDGNIKSSVL